MNRKDLKEYKKGDTKCHYEPVSTDCHKCGTRDITIEHKAFSPTASFWFRHNKYVDIGECMRHDCNVCGYAWLERIGDI